MYICIAGKNECAINALKALAKFKIKKKNIFILPNTSDNGRDTWQPSLKKYAKKKGFKITSLKNLYKIENLIFFSIEFEKIINVDKFKSNELFNLHFSLLPKYRGCHTNFYQIYKGERYSGVTLHKINAGIDSGDIINRCICVAPNVIVFCCGHTLVKKVQEHGSMFFPPWQLSTRNGSRPTAWLEFT